MNARSGFFMSIILYEVKRSCIYGIVLIPDHCLPDVYALHMGVGDGIAEIPVEGTEFANVSFPLLSMFVYSTFVMKRKGFLGLKVKVKTKIFYLCLMLSITCVFLSKVVLNGTQVGTEMAVHFLRGPSMPV